jgi:hypothetical protein
VQIAQLQWDAAFKDAETNVEVRLQALGGESWLQSRALLVAQLEPLLQKQNQQTTEDDALAFTELVQQRAKGVIDSPIREVLLASHPDFIKSPALEFSRGYVGTFSTKDHPKAKGVELILKHPLSWKQQEGDRPNIVQKWTSDAGHGADSLMIQIRKLPEAPTEEERAAFFTEDFAGALFGDSGKVTRFAVSKLEQLPVGIVHFSQSVQMLETALQLHGVMYYMVFEDAFISVQLMCGGPGNAIDPGKRFLLVEPLMKQIANSLVLPGKYR